MAAGIKLRWLLLEPAVGLTGVALLIARVATGAFLIEGVWDNVVDADRMAEFVAFMRANGFVGAEFWAPFSIYTQLLAGLLLLPGLLTRWAGLVITITFLVALVMVHWDQSLRDWWPALALVVLGGLFATLGAGRLSADAALARLAKPPQRRDEPPPVQER